MPLYPYRCTQCGHRFEKIQKFDDEPETECPNCHGLLERPLTAPRFHFKGAGWYVNDYGGKSAEPKAESKPAEGTTSPAKTSEAPGSASAATPAATAPSTPPPAAS